MGVILTDVSIERFFRFYPSLPWALVLLCSIDAVEGWTQVPRAARASIQHVVATRERSRIHGWTIAMPVVAAIVPNCTDRLVSGRSEFAHHMC